MKRQPAAETDQQRPDYRRGHARGREQAHDEMRRAVRDHDWTTCECEPCVSIRYVLETVGVGYRPARHIRCVICGRLHRFDEPHSDHREDF